MEIFKLGQIKTLMMFFILIFSFTPMSEKAFAEQTMNIDQDKSTVLITGSNRGIGLALAQNYAEQGWNVIATCRKPKKATDLMSLRENFSNVNIEELDVTSEEQINALAKKYMEYPSMFY
jgi:Dehydrogenases with different specificities (related to short-chain alcohol dehydrogenases)